MSTQSQAVIVFAKAPHLEDKVMGLSAHALRTWHAHLRRRAIEIARSSGASVYVVSNTKSADIQQRGQSFEERLLNALSDVASLGHRELIVIGSDSPEFCETHLHQALQKETCVGPSFDGGFYLLKLRAEHVDLLWGLPWQSNGLLDALLLRVGPIERLATLRDVDDWLDFVRLRRVIPVDLSNAPWTQPFEFHYLPADSIVIPRPRPPRGPPFKTIG